MAHISIFTSPFLFGFDHFERILDRISKTSAESYPPCNIEQMSENRFRITLAVAGFAEGDLSISVEDNQLVIRGRQKDNEQNKRTYYLYRGIVTRQFQRSFVLADGISVDKAFLQNGLLIIELERPRSESRVRTVKIYCNNSDITQVLA